MLIYADTSVFGGVFDDEFKSASRAFFERVRAGDFEVVVSALVLSELEQAPEVVKAFYAEYEPLLLRARTEQPAYALRQAYLDAQVVGPKWAGDALHVAVATVRGCRAIVSWNFKHIVNFRRIPLYNGVNQMQGYGSIAIHTPLEVIFNDDD